MKRFMQRWFFATLVALGVMGGALPTQALTLTEAQKLLSSDGEAGDAFGYSLSLAGDTAVIGAYRDDDYGTDSGAAYIFTRDSIGTWSQQAKLIASDGADGDHLGYAVAVAGDIAVIGSPRDDDNGGDSGSAYVFIRDSSNGMWSQQAKLLASDGAAGDAFGQSVALTNDTAVIGARYDDDNGVDSGSAYVFIRDSSSGMWSQKAKLLASDGAAYDYFGHSVAVSGDTAVIGAYRNDGYGTDSGAAYVFTRDSNGTWSEQAKLLASDGAAGDNFGHSVALSGDTAVIGAYGDEPGSAYVFTRDKNGTWTEQATLQASDGTAYDRFSWSVALVGDTAVIGAYQDDDNGFFSGSAYIFTRNSIGAWVEQAKLLASDGGVADVFGFSVTVDGSTVLIGAPEAEKDGGTVPGAVYVYLLPPEQQLANLIRNVKTLVERNQNLSGLAGPLNGVSLAKGGSEADIKILEAFIRQVETMVRSGHLLEPEGAALIDAANQLIQTIQAGQA